MHIGLPTRRWRVAALLAGALLVGAFWTTVSAQAQGPAPPPAAPTPADVPDASPAERLLFLDNHLGHVSPPRTLHYLFVREGGADGRQTDPLTLALTAAPDGSCCAVHGEFAVGGQALTLPDIPQAHANPVLLYFLEHEVRDLERLTKGQANHFRQRIRKALVDQASVGPATITWGGQKLPATVVHVAPFLDDPFRARFEVQAHREYTFVLADGVPGGVYKMSMLLPGVPAGQGEPSRSSLTLQDPQPFTPTSRGQP